MSMTVEEAIKRKAALEHELTLAIHNFNKESGLFVRDISIHYYRQSMTAVGPRPHLTLTVGMPGDPI